MTEAEWLASLDPTPMLEYVRGKASDRKLRLFTCACCRRLLNSADDERCLHAAQVAENFADGKVGVGELQEAREGVTEVLDEYPDACDAVSEAVYTTYFATYADFSDPHILLNASSHAAQSAAFAAEDTPEADAWVAGWMKDQGRDSDQSANQKREAWRAFENDFLKRVLRQQVLWLHDIFGNPFRPITIDPSWLEWNGGTVVKLAQAIYDERAFDRLPILADALEEAGCSDQDILGHCRSGGGHVRGCWVVDLVLGKK